MKTAVIIMSDPKSGADEALGRMLNGLALAHETREAGDEVEIVFKGAGTRWPGELARLSHPAHEHYQAVRESVKGASLGCALNYGAHEDVKTSGVPLLADQPLPGTPGIAGLRGYYADGWNVVVF